MSTEPKLLRGHATRVRIVGAISGLLFVSSVAIQILDEPRREMTFDRPVAWGVGLGFIGMVVAGLMVRYARCPACGALMKQGDAVLIWGATGGIGGYAVQFVLNGGGIPVGVVSSPERAELLHQMGCEHVIDRKAAGYQFWSDEHTQDEKEWRRFGKDIRSLIGDDPDIVFEHPGRSTMGASIFAAKRGGTVVTCAATSGFMVEFDNRHFWMKLKRLISSHFANYAEAWAANRLIDRGRIHPVLSETYTLDRVGEAARAVHQNEADGKLGVLCLAPSEGLGITDPDKRDRIGDDKITRFRRR